MRYLRIIALVLGASCISGCGVGGLLLGTDSDYMFFALDSVAKPNEEVMVRARLESDQLQAMQGYVVHFYRDGDLYKSTETNSDGLAEVSFTPDALGAYTFRAEVDEAGFPKDAPGPQDLVVACYDPEAPMVIVDLDKTVVASGFHVVLAGDPKPMPGSPEVLTRIAETYQVVYLTHRPEYFSIKSKRWLAEHKYPVGPLLMSDIGGFLEGSGEFKTRTVRDLRERFPGLRLGIGDKFSDATAYHDNGMRAYLIVQPPDSDDPDDYDDYEDLAEELGDLDNEIQVVTSWDEIERGLFGGASFPRERLEQQMWATARQLEEEHRRDDDDDDDDDDEDDD
ncbi:MAG: LNS2 domain-containing protein [Planctomycetota bacterium]|jgi:hypothetical protein